MFSYVIKASIVGTSGRQWKVCPLTMEDFEPRYEIAIISKKHRKIETLAIFIRLQKSNNDQNKTKQNKRLKLRMTSATRLPLVKF